MKISLGWTNNRRGFKTVVNFFKNWKYCRILINYTKLNKSHTANYSNFKIFTLFLPLNWKLVFTFVKANVKTNFFVTQLFVTKNNVIFYFYNKSTFYNGYLLMFLKVFNEKKIFLNIWIHDFSKFFNISRTYFKVL